MGPLPLRSRQAIVGRTEHNNLFDQKHYDGLGTFNSCSYGEPPRNP